MPLADDELKELKSKLVLSRNKPMNFGLCLGKRPEGCVLLLDLRKRGEALAKIAKSAGETPKTVFGTATSEGTKLSLTCLVEPPKGVGRALKKFFKSNGVKMKVYLLDAEGQMLEADEDDEAETAQAEDPNRAKWEAGAAQVGPRVEAALAAGSGDVAKIGSVWTLAQAKAEAGEFTSALQALKAIAGLLKEAASAAQGPDWATASAELAPKIAALEGDTTPEALKLRATWDKLEALAAAGQGAKAVAALPKIASALEALAAEKAPAAVQAEAAEAPAEDPAPSDVDRLRAELAGLGKAVQAAVKADPARKQTLVTALREANGLCRPETVADCEVAMAALREALAAPIGPDPKALAADLRDIWDAATSVTDRQLDTLLAKIRADDVEEAQAVAELGLSAWSRGEKTKLMQAFLTLAKTPSEKFDASARQAAAGAFRAYRTFLLKHPAVDFLEENPWNVKVELSGRLSDALSEMERRVLAA